MKTLIKTLFFLLLITQICFAQWVQTGPYGGNVNCLAISGSNLLAGGNSLYLSTNNGTSWNLVNNGLPPNIGISGISVSGE